MVDVKIEPSWKALLAEEFSKPYFLQLVAFLKHEKRLGKVIYPPGPLIFNAFEKTPFEKVKVVLLGQDPYHGPNQAHGLAFSVPYGVPKPPSLVNIFKELKEDIGCPEPPHGNLEYWAEQGVFLLNAILTVEANRPGSHRNKGWERFTDTVIQIISAKKSHVVFLLWGKYAREKCALIDSTKHCILTAAHPSPYSAQMGFFGSRPFSKTNQYLIEHQIPPINWCIPPNLPS